MRENSTRTQSLPRHYFKRNKMQWRCAHVYKRYDENKAILIAKKWREACHVKQRLTDEQRILVHKYLKTYYSPEQIAQNKY